MLTFPPFFLGSSMLLNALLLLIKGSGREGRLATGTNSVAHSIVRVT
jgi:hypothetical protein